MVASMKLIKKVDTLNSSLYTVIKDYNSKVSIVDLSIEYDSGTPIYLQLKDQIRRAISVGELRPNDSLPSIRKLESSLGVNRNTIRRAYLELHAEDTLIMQRGKEAVIAPRPAKSQSRISAQQVLKLARKIVQKVETEGLDGIWFTTAYQQAAFEHDTRYPKLVFIECSQAQVDYFTQIMEATWNRRVCGIDLNRLRENPGFIPPSTKYVLSTELHLAEVKQILKGFDHAFLEIKARLSSTFFQGVYRLSGLKTGLLLRDRESISGMRQLVRSIIQVKGDLEVALLDDHKEALNMIKSVDALVYTTPCQQLVKKFTPNGIATQELLFEPVPEELEQLKINLFSP